MGKQEKRVRNSRIGTSAASLESVCLDIRGKPLLSEVTWNVGLGEKWVVLGLNGSGKTSLLLANGRVAALGKTDGVLTGPAMRRIYGEGCRIDRQDGRSTMRFTRG
jgi:ABC-type molybdenum transport system ATPase subunit/photorepair protein PhrA